MNTVQFDSREIIPGKIVCVGWNYVDHINELESEFPSEPVIFIKPNTSISKELYSQNTDGFHYEGEICFMIMNKMISGVGFGFDVTKRKVQVKLKEHSQPWERAKAFDKSAVFSSFIPFKSDFSSLRIELVLNGKTVQQGGYDLMIYKPEFLVDEIQHFLTLEDGDILMTGTPKGVGNFVTGDQFVGRIFSNNKLLIEESWIVK